MAVVNSLVFKTSHVYPVEFANVNIQQGLKLEHYSSDTDFMDKH